MPQIFRTIAQVRAQVAHWRQDGLRIGFVPTMGCLHEGHFSLMRQATTSCQRVVASIFVNPTQFDAQTDFAHYPRDEARDLSLLKGVHAVFIPSTCEIYPEGHGYSVHSPEIGDRLEGGHRPGHFNGMSTVVLKLLNIINADAAFFGEKDWQQLILVKRMATDFNLTTEIVGCPTVREPDGLAQSSRNVCLSPEARRLAPALYRAVSGAARRFAGGENREIAENAAIAELASTGITEIDYLQICDERTLTPASSTENARVFVAARIEGTRLIDNCAVRT